MFVWGQSLNYCQLKKTFLKGVPRQNFLDDKWGTYTLKKMRLPIHVCRPPMSHDSLPFLHVSLRDSILKNFLILKKFLTILTNASKHTVSSPFLPVLHGRRTWAWESDSTGFKHQPHTPREALSLWILAILTFVSPPVNWGNNTDCSGQPPCPQRSSPPGIYTLIWSLLYSFWNEL